MTAYVPDAPLSLAHLSEIGTEPFALIRAAAEAGFASIGLRTAPAAPGGPDYPLRTAAEQAEMRRLIEGTGVAVLYIEFVSLNAATRAVDHEPMLAAGAAIGARRLAVGGESADHGLTAGKLAEVADLAARYGIAVDLEFMPYRGTATFADALEVVRRAGRPNAHVLLDALHFVRSNSALDDLRAAPPGSVGGLQLCDGPRIPPPTTEGLIAESRLNRALPGEGDFPLADIVAATPGSAPLGVEVPLYTAHPGLTVAARLKMLVSSTRRLLAQGTSA